MVFIHGGPNAGSTWAPMLKHFHGFRCLLVDRPGTGLSEPNALTARNLLMFGARFVGDVLDGLGIEKAHVVASSFGGHLALRSAAAQPGRFMRMVQMAAPAAVPGQLFPPFMRSLKSAVARRVMNALPPNRRINRSILDKSAMAPASMPASSTRYSSTGTSLWAGTPTRCVTMAT